MTPAAAHQLFIYYRVHAQGVHAAIDAATRMQAALRAQHAGLLARLWRRPQPQDGTVTLMEAYAMQGAAGVDAALHQQIERQAAMLSPWLSGPRHAEWFDAVD